MVVSLFHFGLFDLLIMEAVGIFFFHNSFTRIKAISQGHRDHPNRMNEHHIKTYENYISEIIHVTMYTISAID
ncbi:hypothetical protein L6452_37458 [Arctium lappa]|uniref:Uncharacterized protein n=1 Tax=Arctium lappa TaxID=4217 RepID=A0ACB8Y311_ARCLA|nr:hypothetical protein L6452_37458 [Arctium lappa]